MASRENTTLQGVVIALVLLLLIMFVVAFLINNKRAAQEARANDAMTQAQQAQTSLGQIQAEANSYKTWMGFGEDDSLETIQKSFEEDVAKYGASFDETDRFYSPLLANLSEANKNLSKSDATAKAENKQLKEKLLATEKEKDLQIQQFSKEANKAAEDLKAERAKFEQSRAAMNAEKDKLSQQLADQRQQIDKVNADASVATKKQLEEVTAMKQDIEILRGNQLDPDPFAQPEDGLISWVNQKEGKVWVNIGEADALRPQVTFSVYSGDEADALKADTKGSIEVIKILSPHLAEARITSDIPTRPLMEGDKIYSQVWNRGRQVGFALAGILDMDNDGKTDIEELKTVIALNNGKVDAQPGENGEVAGEMTVDTRYLILGKFPESSVANADNERAAWETMTENADRLGIETITLDEFLNLMGWKADRRTVMLGPSAKPDDFPAKKPNDYKPPRTSAGAAEFRPRKPEPTY